MRWGAAHIMAAAAALTGSCDRLGLGPREAPAAPTQAAVEAPAVPDLRPLGGASYADFLSRPGMERYAPAALGLSEADAARFAAAMGEGARGELVSGGGAEALVFTGCSVSGCGEAAAVLAVDASTGAPFLAVRDGEGEETLIPNARVEALLRLTSPTGRWDAPRAVAQAD